MPLLIVSGFPCSGKSKRAGEISEHMTQRGIKTVIVSDQSEGVNTRTAYSTAASEKQARGVIKSAVDRSIAKDVLVIVDSLNYIKGFRYELYCIARAMQTPHCIVHTLALDSDCVERHSQLGEPYGEGNAKRLIQRFETPNPQQRWDRPTFAVTEDESLPLGDIYKCLFQPERQVKAHQATQSQPLSGTNFLYELDRITQAIVSAVISAMPTAVIGDQLVVPESIEKVSIRRKFTMSELHRIRQAFIAYSKTHPVPDTKQIGSLFVSFINHGHAS